MPSSAIFPDEPADAAGLIPPALVPTGVRTRSFASLRTIVALILREMSTRYGRTPGGFIWALLEPVGAILILSVAFSLMMRSPALGASFPLFYATGYLPFATYQSVANSVSRSLTFSRPLLAYPAVTWLDALLARFALNFFTSVMIGYILLTAFTMFSETRAVIEIMPIIVAFSLAGLFGLAVGTLNCALFGMFPVWEVIWTIVTRPLFLASGVIILYDHMPKMLQDIVWYNPLLHISGEMRRGFYAMYSPQYISLPFVIGVSLVCLALGLVLLRRFSQEILNDG